MGIISTPDPRLGAEGFVPLVHPLLAEPELIKPGISFEIHYNCVVCGKSWKESEFRLYNGKRYGVPCGCSKDIVSLQNRGRN